MFTGKCHTMDLPITEAELNRWRGGELIQNVWPTLSPSNREFIKTGVTAEEWNETFGTTNNDSDFIK
jgi:hypothetical protein